MAAGGCGRIVLTSRSQPNPQAQKTIERMRAIGADIVVECGNIAEPDTADAAGRAATATGLPLRGVLHAAAVVEDATLANITDELIERDWAPKVYGAWHLHRGDAPTSRWTGSARSPRRRRCSARRDRAPTRRPTAGWTPSPHGAAARAFRPPRSPGARGRRSAAAPALAERGDVTMISPEDGAYAFQALLRHDRGYTGYLPLTGMPLLTALAARSPFAEAFRESDGHHAAGAATVLAELAGWARKNGRICCVVWSPTRSA